MRYLRLYLHFLRFSFSRAMEFRLDFTFKIIMDCFFYLVNLSFYKILFMNTPTLAGWSEDQAFVFVSSYLFIDALHMTVFASNMWWLPFFVNRGDLDSYLTRPVSTLFFISLRDFAANSFVNLLIAIGIFSYALTNLQTPYTLGQLFFYLGLILNGWLLHYVLQMIFIIPVFWTQSSRGFNDFFFSMGMAIERPDLIYRGWLRYLLTMILPFSLIVSFPARVFFGPETPNLLTHLFVVTIVMWAIMLLLWKRGLRAYSSASS
ncbi:MAG: ABC-2 family transporter protein [Bacteriovoracaceae bacterium]|nr:ABC-2 family transporter protein [Bacteriovoracaceae bacterium]